ncbi:MAG: toll/interleukin-1 receptor domain-containing protein [Pyrinomonadaceae bacterium]|nr:toll/interleukin-1 receptor domain-containing protein [Pyrinomonadaceae bacterium]
MAYKVFISSSSRDSDLARDLAKRLEKAGLYVIMPSKSIEAGADVVARIRDEMRKASEVIVIMTNNSVHSPWLLFEMGYATSLGLHLTPLVQGVEPKELPEIIKQMEYVKYSDLDRYIARLQERGRESSQSAA